MDVASTTTTAATTKPTSAAATKSSALSSDFETFLRMLTTQMENQDPLNPMESTEFATQLATFSSVEQQTKANDLLTAMVGQLGLMSMSQVTGWVGMEARTRGPVWIDDSPAAFTPDPASAADRMAIVARNEKGVEVGRLEMAASNEPLTWTPTGKNGQPLVAGAYSFELQSLNGSEVLKTEGLDTYSTVREVRSEDGQTLLVLDGGIKIDPLDVTALRKPEV